MATSIDVLDQSGKKSGSVELPADVFDVVTNIPLMHQVVVAQLAAARQGTHKVKHRGEVSGSGRKPFKQREPVVRVRVRFVPPSTAAVVLCTVQYPAITRSAPPRKWWQKRCFRLFLTALVRAEFT